MNLCYYNSQFRNNASIINSNVLHPQDIGVLSIACLCVHDEICGHHLIAYNVPTVFVCFDLKN